MELGLRGKVALVAAASRGLGRAIAEEFAAEGASVAICARDAAVLERTRSEIAEQYNARVVAVAADLSAPDGVRAVYDGARELGDVDILVNNAGGPPSGKFADIAPAEWERAFHLTLRSAVDLTRLVLPAMQRKKWGRILNVTSIAAKQPVDNLILSNSLRSAVTGFARTLANEVAPFGVTVNNLLPGFTATDRVTQLNSAAAAKENIPVEQVLARVEAQIPMRRLGQPREFAALAAFLASERASYITAQSIAVDGGWIRALL